MFAVPNNTTQSTPINTVDATVADAPYESVRQISKEQLAQSTERIASAHLLSDAQRQKTVAIPGVESTLAKVDQDVRERAEKEVKTLVMEATRIAKQGDWVTRSAKLPEVDVVRVAKAVGHQYLVYDLEQLSFDAWLRRVRPLDGVFGNGLGYGDRTKQNVRSDDRARHAGILGSVGSVGHDSPDSTQPHAQLGQGKMIGRESRDDTRNQRVWQQVALETTPLRIFPHNEQQALARSYFAEGRAERGNSAIRSSALAQAVSLFGEENGASLVGRLDNRSLVALHSSNYRLFREMRADVFNRLPGVNIARAITSELNARARVDALSHEHLGPQVSFSQAA